MHRRTFLIAASLTSIVSLAGLTGCFGAAAGSNGNGNGNGSNATNDSSNSSSYQQVDAETAKELMDTENDYVILDVRTQAEYDQGRIPGAILIPHDTVATAAEDALSDKDQLILVYCRSGNRSKQASQALVDLGYTNVIEFGGINNWPYEVEE
ncbi:rhodanese-like domain-containing protein [Collinsella intestinalis]|uniref:rhodanese-like domain-containing protein n=1 Tax=Collinsella intestinalis TaxID=147207 RepID=UPI0022E5720C|nr:rhodanese-like domain-containing protein [Collinsella intestinalis]